MPNTKYVNPGFANTLELEFYVLPGLQMEVDALHLCGIFLTRLEYQDWILLEKSQFIDDLEGSFVRHPPYFCVFGSSDPDVSEEVEDYRTEERRFIVTRLIRSLRLLLSNEIYNSLEFISYKRKGSLISRDPNKYGRLSYSIGKMYTLTNDDLPMLENVINSLMIFDIHRTSPTVFFAELLFNQSFDVSFQSELEKSLVLLGAIDALIGVAKVPKIIPIFVDEPEMAEFLSRYRNLRNMIAHGKTMNTNGAVVYLRRIARILLCEAIAYIIENPSKKDVTGDALVTRLLYSSKPLGPSRLASSGFELIPNPIII